MRSALVAAERASASLNSRLKDSSAKLAEFAANAGNLKEKLQTVANGIKRNFVRIVSEKDIAIGTNI